MDKKLFVRSVILWFVNSIIIYLGHVIYPSNIVLGNSFLSLTWAVAVAGFLLTVLCWASKTLTNMLKGKVKGRLAMFIYYWLVNSVAIWVIARLASFTGLGISRFYWAFGLGFATNLAQWLIRQLFKTTKLI